MIKRLINVNSSEIWPQQPTQEERRETARVDETISQDIALEVVRSFHFAYALVDSDLFVQQMGGDLHLFQAFTLPSPSLYDITPEMIGSEEELRAVLEGRLARHELSFINRESENGQIVYVSITTLPRQRQDGRHGLLHLVHDMTNIGLLEQQVVQNRNELSLLRRQLSQQNAQLLAANAELRLLDDAKSQFVSAASHELRSPLTALVGFVELLMDELSDGATERQLQFIEMINNSAQRLVSLTNNLLDMTRMDANRLELTMTPVDPLSLVEQVTREVYPMLTAKRQVLSLAAGSKLPYILCDEARCQQVLSNLLVNACKYTDNGGAIRVSVEVDDEPNMVRFSVEDNGVGIPPADLPDIFSRFFRASNVRGQLTHGVGLGLAITRALVELHGGKIWVKSTLGKGSTFYVTFPAVAPQG